MSLLQKLASPNPPSRRWTLTYVLCIVVGSGLGAYAEQIADRLAPQRRFDFVEVGPPVHGAADDELVPVDCVAPRCDVFLWCVRPAGHDGACTDDAGLSLLERAYLERDLDGA